MSAMKMPTDYLASLLVPPDGTLVALVREGVSAPTADEVIGRLRVGDVLGGVEVVDDETRARIDEDAEWVLRLALPRPDGGEPEPVWIWVAPSRSEWLADLLTSDIEWRGTLQSDRDAALHAEWALYVRRSLDDGMLATGDSPLVRYHWLVRVLAAVAPDVAFVVDVDAMAFRSAAWLYEVAASSVLPQPDSLFTIHGVHDEDDGSVWLHTHGLERCGIIELEMLDVTRDVAGEACNLLTVVAAYMIESGVPAPDESFCPGRGIELVWLPWETGIKKSRALGTARADRVGDEHGGARGVLFVPSRGLLFGRKHRSVVTLGKTLTDNPVLFVSNMETERAAQLAEARLDRFRALQAAYGDEWTFLVKLGYPVDDEVSESDVPGREHLWFEVHALEPKRVDATLTNEPYGIARMRAGQRDVHDLALMSDWCILCEHGNFGPDQIGHLERIVDGET